MSMLRTVGTLWVAFLVGAAFALVFLALTDPFVTKVADGLVTSAVFTIGCVAGFFTVRLAGSLFSQRNPQPAD